MASHLQMSLIRLSTILVLVAYLSSSVLAHTYLNSVYVDNQQTSNCVRPHPSYAPENPIPLVTSSDMTCGWLPSAANKANGKCAIAAGSSIGLQWYHNYDDTNEIIEATHKGPIIVYLAKSDTGAGNVWFKIYEDGFDGSWAVDRLIAARGYLSVTIPSDIAPGNYLLRAEVIALHNAYTLDGVQPYVGCVELTISGSGKANPSGVAFPGYYVNTDPGLYFNLYTTVTSYPIPGPPIYKSGSPASPSTTTSSASTSGQPSVAPTVRPTNAPTGGNLKVQGNTGNNVWWFGCSVTGGSENTVKVELKDSGVVTSFQPMGLAFYGYYFSQSVQITLPVSLRITSASGKQVVLENFYTSFSDSAVRDTGKDYPAIQYPTYGTQGPSTAPTNPPTVAPTAQPPTAGPTKAPTQAPSTQAPTVRPTTAPTSVPATQAPTQAPTTRPTSAPPTNGGPVKVSVHTGSSAWWFAVAITGLDASAIAKVEIKDSASQTQYAPMDITTWGYFLYSTPNGNSLAAPLSIRVTSISGYSYTASFDSITGGAVANAN